MRVSGLLRAVTLMVAFTRCGVSDIVGNQDCRDFLACYRHTGGTDTSLDTTYGANGTCWSGTTAVANACDTQCKTNLAGLKVSFPDAGC